MRTQAAEGPASGRLIDTRSMSLNVLFGHDRADRLANDVISRIAEDSLRGSIPETYLSTFICDDNRFCGCLGNASKTFFILPESHLRQGFLTSSLNRQQ